MPDAAIIIPHYNDTERLLRCLAVLMPSVSACGADIEVVVVDNASTQSLEPVRAAYPDLRILTEPQKGAAAARNCGARETTAPYLFFLDADCVPYPDWVETALRVKSRADVVGGQVSVFDETPGPRSGAEAFETVFAFDNRSYIEKKGFSGTGNLLTRRDVFEAVGDFRPGMSEDMDWGDRVKAKGFTMVYEHALHVEHPTRSTWQALRHKWRRINAENFGLIDGGPASRLKWSLRGIAMLPSILVHGLRILRTPRLHGVREKAVAMGTLVRLRVLRCGWMLRQAFTGRV